jgi:Txe/YoeB family toxin of Txe-Axe toxin-antitoxin module
VKAGYKHAFEFDVKNIHYDAPRPGHAGSIDFTNTDQVVQNWRNAIQADQNLGNEIKGDMKTYKNQIAPARAQLKNSIHTTWKAKANAYTNSVKDIIRELKTPVRAQFEGEPETLVTDAEAAKMRRIADKVHVAAKLDIDQANQVTGDLTKYVEATQHARDQLKREVHGWKAEGKAVNAGYKHAFKFDMDNIHYDAPKPGHAGSIEFTNTDQVVQNWRSAIQADQNMGKDMVNDFKAYKAEVQPARNTLKNSIKTTWKAKNEAYVNSVKAVIREIQTPVRAQIEGEPETLVTDAQAAKWHRVVERMQAAAKAEIDLANEVQGDVEQFDKSTQPAREQLANE